MLPSASAASCLARAASLHGQGRLHEAIGAYRAALDLDPSLVEAANGLAIALAGSGRPADALAAFERVIALRPTLPHGYVNAAAILTALQDYAGAIERLRLALQRDPSHPQVLSSLSYALARSGGAEEALELARRAIGLAPGSADAHLALGTGLAELGDFEGAAAAARAAVELDPAATSGHTNLGNALLELDEIDDARAAYSRALAQAPADGLTIRRAIAVPAMPESTVQIGELRRRVDTELRQLLARKLAVADPVRDIGRTNFYLAYHGEPNRALHETFAEVCRRACPSLDFTAAHCSAYAGPGARIRVGFVSRFFHDHSIGRTSLGLIAQLDRSRFDVIALFVPPRRDDEMSGAIGSRADRTVVLPHALADARAQIAELRLDVLFFQDIGMEPYTYFLAYSRLAPVQCVSFGHPDTTGIAAMDYFVSSTLFEPEGAAAHYSERLHLIRDVGTLAFYYRPRFDGARFSRRDLGLEADALLYFCPQALFKLHPAFDETLRLILSRDPRSHLVLLEGTSPRWSARLRRRFETTLGGLAGRVAFLPRVGSRDFTSLLCLADVVLDTPHFNGMNTSLQAFATGTPVITLPTAFQRGRHTAAMYRRMGLEEAIATSELDYVERAVRLATRQGDRRLLSEAILANVAKLFEDANVVRGFEDFFFDSVATAAARA